MGLEVFFHHVYEYQKGVRNLILYTGKSEEETRIKSKLEEYQIDYWMIPVSAEKINVFFGHSFCVKVIESFGKKALNRYSHEEDFILGILLGYDRVKQCQRYLERSRKNSGIEDLAG